MSHDTPRERVHRARIDLERAERQLATRWQPWHERLARHRLGLLIGGGLLGGVALATVPPKRWAGVGALLFGGGASLLRSPLGPVLLGVLWSALSGAPRTTRSRADDVRVQRP
jgi:hypothetical protein